MLRKKRKGDAEKDIKENKALEGLRSTSYFKNGRKRWELKN